MTTSLPTALHRSHLFVPGSDPQMMGKALLAGADAVVLDLEDAVAPSAKEAARREVRQVIEQVAEDPSRSPGDVNVRINRRGDSYDLEDLDAVVWPGLDGIRLPKVEDARAIAAVAAQLDLLEHQRGLPAGRVALYLGIETALGLEQAPATLRASQRVARAGLGTHDLLADLGTVGDDDLATLHASGQLVLLSRAAGVGPPSDTVFTAVKDDDGLERAARRARSLGYFGKAVIHPRQIEPVHRVFTPTEDEIAHATAVVDAAARADESGDGAVALNGQMIDEPIVHRARAILALADPVT